MWILWKMRFSKCEFCQKWDFEIVNFVKQWDFQNVNFWINWGFLLQCGFYYTWKLAGLMVASLKRLKKTSVSKSQRPRVVTSFSSFSVNSFHKSFIFLQMLCRSGSSFLALVSLTSSLTECAPMPIQSMPSAGTVKVKESILSTPVKFKNVTIANWVKNPHVIRKFWNLIFRKIHIFEISIFTKFTFLKSQVNFLKNQNWKFEFCEKITLWECKFCE